MLTLSQWGGGCFPTSLWCLLNNFKTAYIRVLKWTYQHLSYVNICFQIGCVFAEYDQFKPTISIQNCIFWNFCINVTQFYINFSRQEHQIYNFHGLRSRAKVISFQPIPSFIFPLQSL